MLNKTHNHEYDNMHDMHDMHEIREPEARLQMVSSSAGMKEGLFACDHKCKGKHKKHHKNKED